MADLLSLPAAEEAQGRRRQMLRTAFGATIAAALADPTVIEAMVNPDGKLWIERASVGRQDTGERLGSEDPATRQLAALVGQCERVVRELRDQVERGRAMEDYG